MNNSQGFRGRPSNYAGTTLQGNVSGKTSIVMNSGATQELYDGTIALNNTTTTYSASTELRWNVTDLTFGEFLAGYQYLKFNNAKGGQTPSSLQFSKERRFLR